MAVAVKVSRTVTGDNDRTGQACRCWVERAWWKLLPTGVPASSLQGAQREIPEQLEHLDNVIGYGMLSWFRYRRAQATRARVDDGGREMGRLAGDDERADEMEEVRLTRVVAKKGNTKTKQKPS